MLLTRSGAISAPRRPAWCSVSSIALVSLAVVLASACGTRGSTASPGGSTATGTASASASAAARDPATTASARATSSGSSQSGGVSRFSAEPPAASLAAEGGDPVTGQLGSFEWNGGGSDGPWLPGAVLAVGSGERLSVTVADGIGIGEWSAHRVVAGTTDGTGETGLGGGGAPIAFAAPAPGIWSIQVTVRFADGLGSAAYYWRLTVR